MASGGSSGRPNSGSRSFDFGSDDVLCSYEDYPTQDPSNGKRPDPSGKDFHESRMGRPLVNVYGQNDDYSKQDVLSAVEKCMKKYADNLLRFLEGISGRLSQLELYCFNLERSVGEFRSDFIRKGNESDLELKSLDKHLQEVHRSVQILRDKQELAETQKELAKLQLVQKDTTSLSHSQHTEDGVAPSVSEPKKHEETTEVPNLQLALALSHQVTAPSSVPPRAPEQNQPYQQLAPSSLNVQQDHYIQNQASTFYSQRLGQPLQPQQDQQIQPLQPGLKYGQQRPQVQDLSGQPPPQQPHIINQSQPPSFPQYQQQWPQQVVQPQQQVTSQAQIRRPQTPPTYTSTYPPYPPQAANPTPETYPGSVPMQVPYSTIPQSGGNRPEAVVPFGYGGLGSTVPQPPSHPNIQRQPPPQTSQSSFGAHLNKVGYSGPAPYMPDPSAQGYTMYNIDGSRGAHPQQFPPGSYPPSNVSALQGQQLPPNNAGLRHQGPGQGPQLMHNHPYGEMIEKAISMGYARDQVVSVIRMMEESGQPVDFNALLDRLNMRPSGASQRMWSG